MGLQTGYKCIGSAGKTVDGREVETHWLEQLVKNYDASKYAAVINLNHWDPRWAGSYGTVLSLKLGTKHGEKVVFANLEPNEKLISLSKQEVLFSSMEIHPNFQESNEAYLIGLAVTPKPASTSTEQLNLSCSDPKSEKVRTEFIPIELSFSESPEDQEESKLLSWLKSKFSGEQSSPEINEPEEDEDDMKLSEETAKQLSTSIAKLTEQVSKLGGDTPQEPELTLEQQIEKLTAQVDELKQGQTAPVVKDEQDPTTKALSDMQGELAKFSQQLQEALGNESDSTNFGDQTDGDDDNSVTLV